VHYRGPWPMRERRRGAGDCADAKADGGLAAEKYGRGVPTGDGVQRNDQRWIGAVGGGGKRREGVWPAGHSGETTPAGAGKSGGEGCATGRFDLTVAGEFEGTFCEPSGGTRAMTGKVRGRSSHEVRRQDSQQLPTESIYCMTQGGDCPFEQSVCGGVGESHRNTVNAVAPTVYSHAGDGGGAGGFGVSADTMSGSRDCIGLESRWRWRGWCVFGALGRVVDNGGDI